MIVFSAFLLTKPVTAEPEYQNITVKQAHRMIKNNPDTIIIDVRNQSEYDLGHLYNAILIPVFTIENKTIPISLPEPSANDSIAMDIYERANNNFKLWEHLSDKIIVYCSAGSRSAIACQILVEHGFTKVYNMQGGITAWMQANYQIYTTYHHVTVDSTNCKTVIDIEPWLLYKSNCSSCQSQEQPSLIQDTQTNETVIEESENHIVLLITEEINGTIHEYTLDRTVLWQYTEVFDDLNRTIKFLSAIITEENNSTQLFGLYDTVEHEDYNLTVGTILYPIDSETYDLSLTKVEYTPTGAKKEFRQ